MAIEVLRRIDEDGAYANLVLPARLADSDLDERDRRLVTEIVYGATRMRRAVDWLVDRFLVSPPPPALRAALRAGAYQLAFTRIPPHAAVNATVDAAAKRNRGVVNAVLRKVSDSLPVDWPSEGVRLSYPDWMIDRLVIDLGHDAAMAMLAMMNQAPEVTQREDGYIQDLASQWVVELVEAGPADMVLDLCAGPGGKTTGLASQGANVVAADLHPARARLVADNCTRLGHDDVRVVVADALAAPFSPASFDRVLVDAPCSGLGVLRRRPDARWRIQPSDVEELADLQVGLLDNAVQLVADGGMLVYSVCTVTALETVGVAERFASRHGGLTPVPVNDERWSPLGTGGRLLPQDHGTDAMTLYRWTVAH